MSLTDVGQRSHLVARSGARWDVLSSVLPVEGQMMLAAGQHAAFVRSLFPVEQPHAEAAMIDRLGSMTGLVGAVSVEEFLATVQNVWGVWGMSRARISDVFYIMSGTVTAEVDRLRRLREAVTGSGQRRWDGMAGIMSLHDSYRFLCECVRLLGAWAVLGDEVFTATQLELLDKLAEVWLAVLDRRVA